MFWAHRAPPVFLGTLLCTLSVSFTEQLSSTDLQNWPLSQQIALASSLTQPENARVFPLIKFSNYTLHCPASESLHKLYPLLRTPCPSHFNSSSFLTASQAHFLQEGFPLWSAHLGRLGGAAPMAPCLSSNLVRISTHYLFPHLGNRACNLHPARADTKRVPRNICWMNECAEGAGQGFNTGCGIPLSCGKSIS